MKKVIILVSSLFLLSVFILIFAFGWVDWGKDKTAIAETTLYGDISAADGLQVICNTRYEEYMFWNSVCTIAEAVTIDTDFEFVQSGRREQYTSSEPGISFGGTFWDGGCSGSALKIEDVFNGYAEAPSIKMAEIVAEETENGKVNSKIFTVAEYYEYYPLDMYYDYPVYLENNTYYGSENLDEYKVKFDEYFNIPMDPGIKMQITVEKDEFGNIINIERSIMNCNFGFEIHYAYDDEGIYFVISVWTTNDYNADIDEIFKNTPDGNGVYYLPRYTRGDHNHITGPKIDELKTVFKIEDGENAVALDETLDGKRLLLVTESSEKDRYYLTVIDMQTHEQLQRIEIMSADGNTYRLTEVRDGYIVPTSWNGQFVLLEETEDGTYTKKIESEFNMNDAVWNYMDYNPIPMDYDGKRLAVAASESRYTGCAFTILVYDETGCIYAGNYVHNQNTDVNATRCQMGYYDALMPQWTE